MICNFSKKEKVNYSKFFGFLHILENYEKNVLISVIPTNIKIFHLDNLGRILKFPRI